MQSNRIEFYFPLNIEDCTERTNFIVFGAATCGYRKQLLYYAQLANFIIVQNDEKNESRKCNPKVKRRRAWDGKPLATKLLMYSTVPKCKFLCFYKAQNTISFDILVNSNMVVNGLRSII